VNGAESLLRSLVAGGVELCVANPGTSEMHFVAALDRVPGMRVEDAESLVRSLKASYAESGPQLIEVAQ
jgi:thiamine pyrophosphate-dependent acetolactate synthase large subunit-like protein